MKIEIAIPCYNEEFTIDKVIKDFRAAKPHADIVVYDNNSIDKTSQIAFEAGARVVRVNQQGKGHVVQKIFELSKAEVIVMVDGDDTYEAKDIDLLINPIIAGDADMTIGTRLHANSSEFKSFHHFGNKLLTWMLNTLFRTSCEDILSGYRAFSRHFIENVPLMSKKFEIETELMIQALEHSMSVKEIPTGFRNRPEGSFSKLNSFRDGYRILMTMIMLLRDHRPLVTFTFVSMAMMFFGVGMWIFGFTQAKYVESWAVFRNMGVVLMAISIVFFIAGLILNTINTRLRELMSLMRRKS